MRAQMLKHYSISYDDAGPAPLPVQRPSAVAWRAGDIGYASDAGPPG
ncbi:hypothetical protein R6G73_06290 [Actinotignum sanguinis]|nr:hypothetical protein [Actinotignum sanguinis]MDY5148488.1 hypothetical protein [Actinotignum sanguinis]